MNHAFKKYRCEMRCITPRGETFVVRAVSATSAPDALIKAFKNDGLPPSFTYVSNKNLPYENAYVCSKNGFLTFYAKACTL